MLSHGRMHDAASLMNQASANGLSVAVTLACGRLERGCPKAG